MTGTDENFLSSRNFDVAAGRNIGPGDVEFGRAVAVIGNGIAERIFLNEDPLGKAVRMDGQSYTVIGVLAAKGSSFGQSQDNFVVIPITQFMEVYGRARR